MVDPKENKKGDEQEEEKPERTIPVPPPHHKHKQKHWEHLPGAKRKPVRSFKSPGRK